MTEFNVQLKDMEGNLLSPATKSAIVKFADGATLESLKPAEAGAQVNKIEKIKLNGTELSITSKEVDVVLPAAAEYTLVKAASADEGFSATYQLTKDGTPVGDKINIAKDMVVQSGSVKVVDTADAPVVGYKVGDKYIDLVLANTDNQHIYVLVSDLVDTITAADATVTVANNTVKVNLEELKKTFATSAQLTTEVGTINTKFESYSTTEQMNSAISSATEGKADKATTLAGYGITDAYTKTEADGKYAAKATTLAGYGITDAIVYEVLA